MKRRMRIKPILPMKIVAASRLARIGAWWFAVGLAAGAVAGLAARAHYRALHPAPAAPVTILAPVIERAAEDYSVVRIAFEHAGAERACHLVIYHTRSGWTVRC